MILYIIISIIGNFIIIFRYEYKWDWQVNTTQSNNQTSPNQTHTATCLDNCHYRIHSSRTAGIQVAALPSIASIYPVNSYKLIAGLIFMPTTVTKNTKSKNLWGGFSKFHHTLGN